MAASKGHKDVTALLIAKGADVNAKDNSGWTPLQHAVRNGHKDEAEFLIATGADMNAKDDNGCTPLNYLAAHIFHKEKEIAELLITKGADVNAKDNRGWTPLHSALVSDAMDIARALIRAGARE